MAVQQARAAYSGAKHCAAPDNRSALLVATRPPYPRDTGIWPRPEEKALGRAAVHVAHNLLSWRYIGAAYEWQGLRPGEDRTVYDYRRYHFNTKL